MKNNHAWDVSVAEARGIQERLRERISLTPLPSDIRYIGGADVSFNKDDPHVYAGIIVLSYPDLVPVEHAVVKMKVSFPYVPGYLSFREIPPLVEAWKKLKLKPDVVVVDGHGIAHPRRLGIAAHFGLVAEVPTIGAAKSILYGDHAEPSARAGGAAPIIDPKTGEILGTALRTKDKVKPMLISPGHKADVASSLDFTKTLVKKHRLPEPTRLAHNLVNSVRTGEVVSGYARY